MLHRRRWKVFAKTGYGSVMIQTLAVLFHKLAPLSCRSAHARHETRWNAGSALPYSCMAHMQSRNIPQPHLGVDRSSLACWSHVQSAEPCRIQSTKPCASARHWRGGHDQRKHYGAGLTPCPMCTHCDLCLGYMNTPHRLPKAC